MPIPGPTASTPLLQAHSAQSSYRTSRPTSPSHSPSASPSPAPYGSTRPRPSLSPFRRHRRRTPPIHAFPAVLAVLLFAAVAFVAWDVSSIGRCYFKPLCRILGDSAVSAEEIWWRNAGAYAPWRSRGDGGGRKGLPRGCEIDQVNILHRHTARYPTSGASKCMAESLNKLINREIITPRRHPELAFLARTDLTMSGWQFDQLMDQGRKAAWRSGRDFAALYRKLVRSSPGLFSRSAGGGRVVESAQYWLQGAMDDPFNILPRAELPSPNVTIPESDTSNNTLSVHSCPAYETLDPAPGQLERAALFPLLYPTRDRLNAALRPNPPLTVPDIICLGDMCAYDSQAAGENWQGWSRWCGVFSRAEWEIIGYLRDVQRYYEVGQGSAGWINELIARLTDSAPKDNTTTNRTLDTDESTFPRGGERLFLDFSHDNEMIEILSAMNVITQHRPLDTEQLPPKRTYVLSNMIPFGAHLIVERIGCDLGDWEPDPNAPTGPGDGDDNGNGADDRQRDGKKDYVRIYLNDKLLHVDHISCKQSGLLEHGMCELELFLETQSWAQNDVDWGVCTASAGSDEAI
ncbi:hypothetical protein JCM24511_08494 [Saitozyma sp. JCM 24511]|nr:hypothetical protein JCM24511_08494 [Saitozyma sp. JCM 24511]